MLKLVEELRAKLAETTKHSLSAEERSKLMEAAMQTEEKRQEALHAEISQLSVIKFKRGNELHAIKQQKRIIDTEIHVYKFLTRLTVGLLRLQFDTKTFVALRWIFIKIYTLE